MEKEPIINGYLRQMLANGGSDLHLSINFPPKARFHGNIKPLDDTILTFEPAMQQASKTQLEEQHLSLLIELQDNTIPHVLQACLRELLKKGCRVGHPKFLAHELVPCGLRGPDKSLITKQKGSLCLEGFLPPCVWAAP